MRTVTEDVSDAAKESPEQRHMKAMDKVAALVSVRERTCKETFDRLLRAGFTEEESQAALESALHSGLVDEERYTRSYIRGKSSCGWGRRKIMMRLQRDGISEELIESCSDEFPSHEEEYERALHELERKGTSSSNPYAALMRRLVGKGYSYDIAKQAVSAHLKS